MLPSVAYWSVSLNKMCFFASFFTKKEGHIFPIGKICRRHIFNLVKNMPLLLKKCARVYVYVYVLLVPSGGILA